MALSHAERMTAEGSATIETLQTDSNTVKTSWQKAIAVEFYIKYAVLAIGVVGTAANALVLYALITHNARETKKRAINLLIINQNSLDLVCCVLLLASVCIQINVSENNTYMTGAAGYFLCTIFIYDTGTYCALYASVINMVFLTVERYLKVVHLFWSRKNLKRWIIYYAAMVFAWVAGTAYVSPFLFTTTRAKDGVCITVFDSDEQLWIYGSCNFVLFFLVPLVIFVYCYGRMVVVMRRQMRVMAGHGVEAPAQASASQAQSKRIKWNIIKTMIIVSVAFVVCWFPNNIYFVLPVRQDETGYYLAIGYYPAMFLIYLNVCLNPFIYATKHDGVKRQLARLMMVCHKRSDVADVTESRDNGASAAQQTAGTGVSRK